MTRQMSPEREQLIMSHPLRRWRDREGLSRLQMSRRRGSGFGPDILVKWEHWERFPSANNQASLRRVIGSQADDILDEWRREFDKTKERLQA